MIRAIAAIDDKRGIARAGIIPWTLPGDKQHFRKLTEHTIVVMGRETYEQFTQPLPNRRNIVVSHSLKTVRDGFEVVVDIAAFLAQQHEDVWVIGGAGLYESALSYCEELYITLIQADFDCDKFFPEYDTKFALREQFPVHSQAGQHYQFAVFERLKNR